MRTVVFLLPLLLLSACGGESHDSSSEIEGRWSGDLVYTGAECADGNFLGVGSGTNIGTANFEIQGTDEIGSEVLAQDGTCRFRGTRTEWGFTAQVVDGCPDALSSMEFHLDAENDQATIVYVKDFEHVPVQQGVIPCISDDVAYVTR